MLYRQSRCQQRGLPFTFDWAQEKPRVDEQRREIELELYEGLEEQARETLNQMMARQPAQKEGQRFKLRGVKVSQGGDSEMSQYKEQ